MSVLLRYEGSPDGAFQVVSVLRRHGVEVEWTPPPEERSSVVETVLVTIAARGAYDLLKAAVDEARRRVAGRGTVAIDEPPAEDQQDTTNPAQK